MKIIPRASQKTDAIDLPADGTVFAFGADSPFSVHCFDYSSISVEKWWTHVSYMVMNRCQKSALLLWKIDKHSIETFSRRCICSIVSQRGTLLAHSFHMSKFLANIRCKALFEMPTMYAGSRTLGQRLSNTNFWIFFTISLVVSSFGRSLRCLSWRLVRPRLNFAIQYFILVN